MEHWVQYQKFWDKKNYHRFSKFEELCLFGTADILKKVLYRSHKECTLEGAGGNPQNNKSGLKAENLSM